VCALWTAAQAGDEARVGEWEARAEALRGRRVDVNVQETIRHVDENGEEWEDEEEDEEEEEEGMEVDGEAPQLVERTEQQEPIVDEDGFTLVQGKNKGKGRR